jgi:L-malate glycosyltransferase
VQKVVPSRLLMIGDGPERSRAEWLAVNKGIHNKVDFLGKQDRIHEKLGVADVMLLPSQLESFGLAALEAMACEVVPIATNAGGVPEVIDHGETGFLAEVGDVDAMSRHAIEILSDDAKLKRMGEQARSRAQARFCASKIIPMYERHYRAVLDRHQVKVG